MDPEDWTMGQLAAQDGYTPPETFGPTNVIDRRSFVPDKPFEQPTDEEMFQYELMKKMMGNEPLGRGPPPELNPQPEPTGDDELDDARGGLRPMTREELDQFEEQMKAGVPKSREEMAQLMGRPYDPWGLRKGAEDKLSAMSLEQIGLAAPHGGIGSVLRPAPNFDDELRVMRGWEHPGMIERIAPAYPIETFDVGRRRR
jgi:hypothetical protein